MKKVGVLVTLNILLLSSFILVFSLNTSVNFTPLDPSEELIETIDDKLPVSSAPIEDYDYEIQPYVWEDLASDPSATDITNLFTNGKDDGYYSVFLSFQAELYDYNSWWVYISTNGYVSLFDNTPDRYNNYGFPISIGDDYRYMIAGYLDDINLNNGGQVYFRDFGDRFVVEYDWVYHINNFLIGSFEIVIYDNGSILYNYENLYSVAGGVTCGINHGDGTYGSEYYGLSSSTSFLTLNWTMPKPELIFWDDFESGGDPMWSQDLNAVDGDYWHISNESAGNYSSPIHSLRCANSSTKVYERNTQGWSEAYTDVLAIENINLQNYEWAKLSFAYKSDINTDDRFKVYVYIPGGAPGFELYFDQEYVKPQLLSIVDALTSGSMQNFTYDLSPFCGYDRIDIHFVFDASNTSSNFYNGVYIDDVNITGVKLDHQEGNELGIHTDDVFYYYFTQFDLGMFQQVFGMDPNIEWDMEYQYEAGNGDEGTEDPNQIKIQIMSIVEEPDSWEITIRFWMPFENFDSIGAGEEMEYRVFKNALNFKGGCDFFIPTNDLYTYLSIADNVVGGGDYDVECSSEYDNPVWITLHYDKFIVELKYNQEGILNSFSIRRDTWETIMQIFLREDDCPDCDDYNDEGDMMIPGYDLMITFFACFLVSAITIVKLRKSIRK